MFNSKWQIGESVVVRQTSKQGKVVDAAEDAKGVTENVQVQYNDGSSEWMPADKVSKFLVEVDPKRNNQFLTE
tara:strand:- start:1261 stop:1479 length:219 start_codon:yes stop_codon:yes gene_type:complete